MAWAGVQTFIRLNGVVFAVCFQPVKKELTPEWRLSFLCNPIACVNAYFNI